MVLSLWRNLNLLISIFLILASCAQKSKKNIETLPPPGPTADLWIQSARLGDLEKLLTLKSEDQRSWDYQSQKGGVTVLMVAARNGHVEIVKRLLTEKADVNILDRYSYNALSYALYGPISEIQKGEMCDLLVGAGADPFVMDHLQLSPILVMIDMGFIDCIQKVQFSKTSPCDQQKRLTETPSLINYANADEESEISNYLKSQGCN